MRTSTAIVKLAADSNVLLSATIGKEFFMLATAYAHLGTANDVPFIQGTRYKVIDLALMYLAYSWSVDEIHRQHPDLSKAQISSAMAYYYDHQEEMDRQISEDDEEIKKQRLQAKQIIRGELLARVKR